MRIDRQSLSARQAILVSVEVTPAALHDADARIGQQMRQRPAQKIGRRQEVGVKDGEIFALTMAHSLGQGAGFEAPAIGAADMLNLITARFQFGQLSRDERHGQIVRIIQRLYQEFAARVIEGGHRVNQAARDLRLVVQRQLHGNRRQFI